MKFSLIIIGLLCWSTLSLALEKKADCSEFKKAVPVKVSQLEQILSSLQALEASDVTTAMVPLSQIFSIDLTNEAEVSARIEELKKFLTKSEILTTEEYAGLEACFKNSPDLELLNNLVSRQEKLNKEKLHFLQLPVQKRKSLLETYTEIQKNKESAEKLETQLSESKASIDEAQSKLDESTEKAFEENPSAELEKFIISIESEHIEFIRFYKDERKEIEKLGKSLRQIPEIVNGQLAPSEISKTFDLVDSIWNQTAEILLELFSTGKINSRVDMPGRARPSAFIDEEAKQANAKYELEYQKATLRFTELQEMKKNLLTDLKAQSFRVLNESGQYRAYLIKNCYEFGVCDGVRGLNERYLRSFLKEIRILPLKFLAGGINKVVEVRGKLRAGFDSWVDLARQVSVLLFLILLPFLAHRLFAGISRRLEVVKSQILARSVMDFRRRTLTATWINRFNPFIPSVGMIASIHLARILLETTDLRELSYLLFYLEVYFVYKASWLVLKMALEYFFTLESLGREKEKSDRAELTAKRFARLIFVQFALLHLIEDTVRKALVYEAVSNLVLLLSFFLFILEIRNWRLEIVQSFLHRFPNFAPRLARLSERRFGSLLLPVFLIISLGHSITLLAVNQLIRFDFFKRLLSDIFRRKIERREQEGVSKVSPDQEYLKQFDYYLPSDEKLFVDRDPTVASGILKSINGWLATQTSDDLVVIIGNRGLGKTTTLKTIMRRVEAGSKHYHRVPPRITTKGEFYQWLSEICETPLNSLEDFLLFDSQSLEKRIFFIDDVHNLFLAQIGGFEAYRAFMELIGLRTRNTFWCLAVATHSWTYLQGVLGRDHFYGKTYKLRMWTDQEIQKLILNRHEATGYSRTFDESVSAYGTGNVLGEKTEVQFFRLLWGQSRGNPRAALMHWVSAISEPSSGNIHVGVPQFIESSIVGTMSTEALILLASIARHDSLTSHELIRSTGLDLLIVRKCLKEAHEKELIWSDTESRIRISSRAQGAIDYYLVGKNFLYE